MNINPNDISLIIGNLSYRTEGIRDRQVNTAHLNFICREFIKDQRDFINTPVILKKHNNKYLNNSQEIIEEIKKIHTLIIDLEKITLTKKVWREIKLKYFSLFERNYGQLLNQLIDDFERLIEWEEKQIIKSSTSFSSVGENIPLVVISNLAELYEYFTGKKAEPVLDSYKDKIPFGPFYQFSEGVWKLIFMDTENYGYYYKFWLKSQSKPKSSWLSDMTIKHPEWRLNKEIINNLSFYSVPK